jgi:hypothetical protein
VENLCPDKIPAGTFAGTIYKKMTVAGSDLNSERIPVSEYTIIKQQSFQFIFRRDCFCNINKSAHIYDLLVKIFLDYLLNIQFNESVKFFKT